MLLRSRSPGRAGVNTSEGQQSLALLGFPGSCRCAALDASRWNGGGGGGGITTKASLVAVQISAEGSQPFQEGNCSFFRCQTINPTTCDGNSRSGTAGKGRDELRLRLFRFTSGLVAAAHQLCREFMKAPSSLFSPLSPPCWPLLGVGVLTRFGCIIWFVLCLAGSPAPPARGAPGGSGAAILAGRARAGEGKEGLRQSAAPLIPRQSCPGTMCPGWRRIWSSGEALEHLGLGGKSDVAEGGFVWPSLALSKALLTSAGHSCQPDLLPSP